MNCDPLSKRAAAALEFAQARAETARHWHELHNSLYGVGGKLGELFPTVEERAEFLKTPECEEIQKLIDALAG